MAIMKTLTLNGTTFAIEAIVPADYVTLKASSWVGESSPYSQIIALPNVTPTTKVDLQPTVDQLNTLYGLSLGFFAVNEDGVVTVYAVGSKPTIDFVFQVTKTEVGV